MSIPSGDDASIVDCRDGQCPTVHDTDPSSPDIRIQGYTEPAEGLPDGEAMVRVPRDLILKYAEQLRVGAPQ
ncbi:hypothetical protein [Nonomuraea sp. NPDC049480]|uniref:hypothetical protein n=1 Tax=Nonomuraea sp. NPDC049480 TaxID=3364353 RepID=UPI00379D1794